MSRQVKPFTVGQQIIVNELQDQLRVAKETIMAKLDTIDDLDATIERFEAHIAGVKQHYANITPGGNTIAVHISTLGQLTLVATIAREGEGVLQQAHHLSAQQARELAGRLEGLARELEGQAAPF